MLTVLKYPEKSLKTPSKVIVAVTPSLQQLAKEMLKTMYAEKGIGLAAPQVGEGIRLIVLDVPLVDPLDPQNRLPDPTIMINPLIVTSEGLVQSDEGCLSCPELIVTVDRAEKVSVSYLDVEGKEAKLATQGLKAICIQHEIDHLNGILLVDKLSRLERDFYQKKRVRQVREEKEFAAIL